MLNKLVQFEWPENEVFGSDLATPVSDK
jgi:hypothetical protein